jgi:hypothetical protein
MAGREILYALLWGDFIRILGGLGGTVLEGRRLSHDGWMYLVVGNIMTAHLH